MEPSQVTHLPSPAPTSTSTEVPPRPHLARMHSSTWRRMRGVSTGGWRAWLLPAHCGGLQTPSSCCVFGGPPTPSRSQQAARAAHLAVHGGRPAPPPKCAGKDGWLGAALPTGGSNLAHLVHATALDGAVEPLHALAATQLVLRQLASAEQMNFRHTCTAALVCRLCKAGQRLHRKERAEYSTAGASRLPSEWAGTGRRWAGSK